MCFSCMCQKRQKTKTEEKIGKFKTKKYKFWRKVNVNSTKTNTISKMDADRMLEKCGDFNHYQLMMLSLFGVINILSSIHYYSQTIINFVPNHWWVLIDSIVSFLFLRLEIRESEFKHSSENTIEKNKSKSSARNISFRGRRHEEDFRKVFFRLDNKFLNSRNNFTASYYV